MYKFFVPAQAFKENKIILNRTSAHHLKDVLRLKKGERIVVFDEKGQHYCCGIEFVRDKVVLEIREKMNVEAKKDNVELAVACAIPKNCKFDDIVDKLTQLGAERIIPMFSQRVIIRWDKTKQDKAYSRWQKIALAASQQCQRLNMPLVDYPMLFSDALKVAQGYSLRLIAYLSQDNCPLPVILAREKGAKKIIVFIGPEGDFTPEEIRLAREAGFLSVSLGDNILRVDTACIAAAALVKLATSYISQK